MSVDKAADRAEFDRLMTAATVFRRRGDYGQATQAIKEALRIFPDDLAAREFAADMIYAHGDVQKAADHYKSILEADPHRASAEEKYAKAVLELAEADRQKELLKLMVENPGKFKPVQRKNATIAVVLSAAPGLGHIYCERYVKGIVIFCVWLISVLAFLFSLNPAAGAMQRITTTSVVFACVAGTVHIYALLNAAQTADAGKDDKPKDSSKPE